MYLMIGSSVSFKMSIVQTNSKHRKSSLLIMSNPRYILARPLPPLPAAKDLRSASAAFVATSQSSTAEAEASRKRREDGEQAVRFRPEPTLPNPHPSTKEAGVGGAWKDADGRVLTCQSSRGPAVFDGGDAREVHARGHRGSVGEVTRWPPTRYG